MSKAFTKGDECDAPLIVPARAPIPEGVANYVTREGLAQLRGELARLESERARLETNPDDDDARHSANVLAVRIAELATRLAAAVVVDPGAQPREEVRFGATVRVRTGDDAERVYRIVGVDEADAAQGLIAFIAPLARALLGKRAGDVVTVRTPRGEEELEILGIAY
jgi:transcription elongation factor GreB